MTLGFKTRLFLILLLAGLAGVASFLLVDLAGLVARIPVPPGTEVPTITPLTKLLALLQPTVLLALAVLIGIVLAPKVGLTAPVAECVARGGRCLPAVKPQLVPGLIGGFVGALAILVVSLIFKPFYLPETIERMREFGKLVPIPTRMLYGGITEELLLRWGFMTLVVWILWRVLGRRTSKPANKWFVAAILISSLVFAAGHLPIALMLMAESRAAVIPFVILANSAFGIVAGYLYWKRGLESAIIAHMFCHVMLAIAAYIEIYF